MQARPLVSQDRQVRAAWSQGDQVEIFSESQQKWYLAKVVRITNDDEGEWLECQYARGKREMSSKQVQRYNTDVRPAPADEQTQTQESVRADIQRMLLEAEAEEKKEPERTLALLKPDTFSYGYLSIYYMLSKGFRVLERKQVRLTKTRAEAFYAEHKGEDFFEEMIEFMSSGPAYAVKLEKVDAIKDWLALMGPANPIRARQEAPKSVRGMLGTSMLRNAAHGSDSAEAAARELEFFFDCEQTLALIKPDAVAAGKAAEIVARIESEGFTVLERAQLALSKERAEELYGEHKGKDFFDGLVAFMTSGELVALKLEKKDAIKAWRTLMGSIRALYGSSTTENAAHGSDCIQSAVRELTFFFPQQETLAIIKPDAVRAGKHHEIVQRIVAAGFTLINSSKVRTSKDPKFIKPFYAENGLDCMLSGTSRTLHLRATNAIAKLRTLMGPADLVQAKLVAPDSIRAKYAATIPDAVHCSLSAESAKRETDFFFPAIEADFSTKQYTLALVKPDAVASGKTQEILNRIVYEGFVVREQKQLKLSKERAEEFYGKHAERDFFDELIAFMTSGELVALKLQHEDAVRRWRAVMGPTDLEAAREDSPQSVRALFAISTLKNASHGSDSAQSAKRELDFFFAQ